MKLDRNINGSGRGKYGLIKTRALQEYLDILPGDLTTRGTQPNSVEMEALKIANAISFLEAMGIIDWGDLPETEFFVIRLKDRYARCAIHTYADEAHRAGDLEFAHDVGALANRAGVHNPHCKKPD